MHLSYMSYMHMCWPCWWLSAQIKSKINFKFSEKSWSFVFCNASVWVCVSTLVLGLEENLWRWAAGSGDAITEAKDPERALFKGFTVGVGRVGSDPKMHVHICVLGVGCACTVWVAQSVVRSHRQICTTLHVAFVDLPLWGPISNFV